MSVSVHPSIDGEKLEKFKLKVGCTKFEAVGILVLFWLWGQENADKDGLLRDVSLEDVGTFFDGYTSGTGFDSGKIVSSLIETGWIDLRGGKPIIHDWADWETRDEDNKTSGKSAPTHNVLVEYEGSEQIGIGLGETSSAKAKRKYTDGFERFWKAYPRNVDKVRAYKNYMTRLKEGYTDEQIISAAENYSLECKRRHTEEPFIKHPATFLSDSLSFLDYTNDSGKTATNTENKNGEYLPFLA